MPSDPPTDLKTLAQQLKASNSISQQSIAQIQSQIVLDLSLSSSTINSKSQKHIIDKLQFLVETLPQNNFQHIFEYLFSDLEYLEQNKQALVSFLKEKLVLCKNGLYNLISLNKQRIILELLLNGIYNFQAENKTFAGQIIEKYCRSDLNFCYSLLFNLNQVLSKIIGFKNSQNPPRYNLNQITTLAIRIIKNYSKLPSHLINQALRFMIDIFYVYQQQYYRSKHQIQNEKAKNIAQITQQLCQYVLLMINNNHKTIGYAYKFLGFYLSKIDKWNIQRNNKLFPLILIGCKDSIGSLFPTLLESNKQTLQNEIQKIQQTYKQIQFNQQQLSLDNNQIIVQHQENSKETSDTNIQNKIQINLRMAILRGVSYFIKSFFSFLLQQNNQHQVIQTIFKLEIMEKFVKIFEMLSSCNDVYIFSNFIAVVDKRQKLKQLYQIQFDLDEEYITKRIIQNCPTPIFKSNNKSNNPNYQAQKSQQSQLYQVMRCLYNKMKIICQQNGIQRILQLIRGKIQKQYDQAFNVRQFQSACNALTFIFKISTEKYIQQQIGNLIISEQSLKKQKLSKQEMIEWIKMLLNLNQSCLSKHRKCIVNKTYQLISSCLQVILPGNQYLQQVIQKQLIQKSYPQKSQNLQALISFYQQKGGQIFQLGYANKFGLKNQQANNETKSDLKASLKNSKKRPSQLQEQNNSSVNNIINSKQKDNNNSQMIKEPNTHQFSNQFIRKNKIIQRIYSRIQDKRLSISQIKYLWKIVFRIYDLEVSQQSGRLNLEDLKKVFVLCPRITLVKYLAALEYNNAKIRELMQLKKDQIVSIKRKLQKWPIFYKNQLRQLKYLNIS